MEFSDSAVKVGRQDEIAASKSRALTWHWKGKSRPAGPCTSCTRLGPEYSYLRRRVLGPAIKQKVFPLKAAN